MNYKHIIFDFNGTLVDSTEIICEILSGLIAKSRFKNLTPKDFEKIRDLPPLKKAKVLFFTIKYQRKFLDLFSQNLSKIKFAEGIKPILDLLNEKNYKFSILSSNSSDMIIKFFELHQIPVASVYRSQRLFGKKSAIKKFLKQNNCSAANVIYIGDEKRDIEVCNKCGVDVIFVKWGIGSDKDLTGCRTKAILQTPEELTEFFSL